MIDQLAERIRRFLEPSVAQHLIHCRKRLATIAARDNELSMTSWSRMEMRYQSEEIVKIKLANANAAHREGQATERDISAIEAELESERAETARVSGGLSTLQRIAADSKKVVDTTDRHLNSLNWPSPKRSIAIPTEPNRRASEIGSANDFDGSIPAVQLVLIHMPDGAPRDVDANAKEEVARLKAKYAELDSAVPQKKTEAKGLRGLVQELAAKGAPKLEGAAVPGARLSISGPRQIIHASPARSGPGWKPTADDALAMMAWLDPEKVLAKLQADLDVAYAHKPLELDPHEKQRRRRQLQAEILAAERIECAALWKLIDEGNDTVRFRPDTDPRAVLGIA